MTPKHSKIQRSVSTPSYRSITNYLQTSRRLSVTDQQGFLDGWRDRLMNVRASLNQCASDLANATSIQANLDDAHIVNGTWAEPLESAALSIGNLDLSTDLLRKSLAFLQYSSYRQQQFDNCITESVETITQLKTTLTHQQNNTFLLDQQQNDINNFNINSIQKVIASCMIVARYIESIANQTDVIA